MIIYCLVMPFVFVNLCLFCKFLRSLMFKQKLLIVTSCRDFYPGASWPLTLLGLDCLVIHSCFLSLSYHFKYFHRRQQGIVTSLPPVFTTVFLQQHTGCNCHTVMFNTATACFHGSCTQNQPYTVTRDMRNRR